LGRKQGLFGQRAGRKGANHQAETKVHGEKWKAVAKGTKTHGKGAHEGAAREEVPTFRGGKATESVKNGSPRRVTLEERKEEKGHRDRIRGRAAPSGGGKKKKSRKKSEEGLSSQDGESRRPTNQNRGGGGLGGF